MINAIKRFTKKHNLLSTKKLRYLLVGCFALTATGCLKVEGVHYINHHGDSDRGGYVVSMNSALYLSLIADDPKIFDDLYKFSDPSINSSEGTTYISDTSSYAQMEHFYDNFNCVPTPGYSNWSDCTFNLSSDNLNFPNWAVDWQVVLQDEMRVLNSNHHRYMTRNGKPTLVWNFDGNRTSSFDVNFTVRVPNEGY